MNRPVRGPGAAEAPAPACSRDTIPVLRPRLPGAERVASYIRSIDSSGWYSNFGPLERQLRERFGGLLECPAAHVVMAANATLAIAGLVAVSPHPCWDVPAFSFPAVAHAVLLAGCRPHVRDVDAMTLRLPDALAGTSYPAIDVLPFGAPVTRQSLQADRPASIIDAAASLGAANAPLAAMRPQDAVVFSLHATKVLGCGEGAVAVCGSEALASKLRAWTNFGFSGSRESTMLAANAKLSEYAAAVTHAALDEWPETRRAWEGAQTLVRQALAAAGIASLPPHPPEVTSYCIAAFPSTDTADRAEFHLQEGGISTRRWWARGLHRMPAFADFCTARYPVTDDVAGRLLGLPVYPGLTADEAARIQAALLELTEPS